MRTLALILLLLNAGLWGWTRWVAVPPAPAAPRPLPDTVETLTLVDPPRREARPAAPGRRGAAAESGAVDGRTDGADDGTASAGAPVPPQDLAGSAPAVELAGTQLVVVAADDLDLCASIGPFLDLQQAAEFAAAVRQRGLVPIQRLLDSEIWVGYAVLLPPAADREAALGVAARLRAAGVDDIYVEAAGEWRDAVSLGLYSERPRAERRAAQIRALGFDAQVRDRTRVARVYWVDFEVPAGRRVDLSAYERPGRRLTNGECAP